MLGSFVAGAYSGTYQAPGGSAVDIGITEEGYRLRWQYAHDKIDQTDKYGATLIEGFYLGMQMWIGGILKEWTSNILKSVMPWNFIAASGATNLDLGIIGRAATNVAGSLVLTATAGTPAAAAPATLTAPSVALDDGFNVEPVLGPKHRLTPFLFRIYPTTSNTRFLSTT